ncbi:hypothetical protein ATL39_1468 [Sinobaca qinghaiensis]|uniref:Amidohydrolase 3 domain-containing protein n=1 Tax=Sinobaca qinghaiensis TaxID=342944 RepID=A0A419V708_9BACL|nr:amidohydrolase [Sinobaca qinghaiensis]RKD75765.1 hypothetical protein ATL39_1468 [Sinobaca qinghaiensis]
MGTLWHGGTIYTMKQEGDKTEAVYTEAEEIIMTGSVEELKKKYAGQIDREEDLEGAVLYPGFTDSHLHMIGLGETMLTLDLSGCETAEEMQRLIVDKAALLKEGEWLIGEGWNENKFPDRKIFHKQELDQLAPHNPMILTRICRHAALANTEALKKASIHEETPDPPGGMIVKDAKGTPTGYLLDQAADMVKEVMPPVTKEYLEKALTLAVDHMLSMGLTGGHTEDLNYYNSFQETYETFYKVLGEKRALRANLLVHHEVAEELFAEEPPVHPFVTFGAVKIFSDGALGGRTAWLKKPYNDAPDTSGMAIHSENDFLAIVRRAREAGKEVAVHAIGDRALELVVTAMEKYPVPAGKRDRIIHVQVADKPLINRLKQLSVILDLQPSFVLSDFPWVEERLGSARMPYSFAWKTLLDEGLICAGGSDAPIESADPLEGIFAAVARRRPDESHDGYMPDQKLSVFEAVRLYTRGSAEAVGLEEELGCIAPGYKSDFTVLDQDLFSIPVNAILSTNVIGTVVGGSWQYRR